MTIRTNQSYDKGSVGQNPRRILRSVYVEDGKLTELGGRHPTDAKDS